MEDQDGGLFNIEVSSDESVDEKSDQVPRYFQSEEDFQRQRKEWKPKIESGEVCSPLVVDSILYHMLTFEWIWKTLNIPLDNPSKPQSQSILHAIEELYFFMRYEEAKKRRE